jgi:hypothetical protein
MRVPRVAKAQPFYEAGSCQGGRSGLIGSPFYSSFHEQLTLVVVVVSFNGATSLILGYEFFNSGLPRAARHLNQFPNLPLSPLELDPRNHSRCV